MWTDADPTRSELLLKLPKEALLLLLKSDQLKVASEDTILYTISRRMEVHSGDPLYMEEEEARTLIAAVRFTQLSPALLCSAVAGLDWLKQVEETQNEHLLAAVFMRTHPMCSIHLGPTCTSVPNYNLGPRPESPITSHTITFVVDVEKLRKQCHEADKLPLDEHTLCPMTSTGSSVFAGRRWCCHWELVKGSDGVLLGVFVGPDFPRTPSCGEIFWKLNDIELKVGPGGVLLEWEREKEIEYSQGHKGCKDVLAFGPMAGGWDEEAWVKKGLPKEGVLEVTMTVHS
jgi:hypothetical protein